MGYVLLRREESKGNALPDRVEGAAEGYSFEDLPAGLNGSGPSAIVVCGDEIVSRVLALLLRDSGYQAMALPITSSLNEPGALEGVQLLLLTPTPEQSTERRKALLASLKDMPGGAKL